MEFRGSGKHKRTIRTSGAVVHGDDWQIEADDVEVYGSRCTIFGDNTTIHKGSKNYVEGNSTIVERGVDTICVGDGVHVVHGRKTVIYGKDSMVDPQVAEITTVYLAPFDHEADPEGYAEVSARYEGIFVGETRIGGCVGTFPLGDTTIAIRGGQLFVGDRLLGEKGRVQLIKPKGKRGTKRAAPKV